MMRGSTRSVISQEKFHARSQIIGRCETMVENTAREPNLVAIFEDLGDEGSCDGFAGRSSNNDIDVDLVGLEDDDGGPAPGDVCFTDYHMLSSSATIRLGRQWYSAMSMLSC